MDFTPLVPASRLESSACDKFIASVILPSSLVIRSTATLGITRVISLDAAFARSAAAIRWSSTRADSRLLLIHSRKLVYIYNVENEDLHWTIDESTTGLKHVEWSHNGLEVITWAENQLSLTIWSLSGRGFVLPNPKFCKVSHRPGTTQMAVLQRESQDGVSLVGQSEDGNWSHLVSFFAETVDAQGLLFSPNGHWLAIWDHSIDYRILIYTANGLLVRKYEAYELGLGIQTVAWSPTGDNLAIGSFDGKIRLLNDFTFAPITKISHPELVRDSNVQAWREVLSTNERRYDLAQAPIPLPSSKGLINELPKTGISLIQYSPDGRFMASRCVATPTTLWIWSMESMTLVALLIHLNVVKVARWHPDEAALLVTGCHVADNASGNAIYLWSAEWDSPRIVEIPQADFHLQWFEILANRETLESGILFGSQSVVTMGYLVEELSNKFDSITEADTEEDIQCETMTSDFNGSSSLIIHQSPQAIQV